MPFNVIHDLPSSPVGRIVDLAVFLNDLLQLLFTIQLEIDHLHDRHQVEVVLHHRVFALVALQEDRLALREGSEDIGVEQFVEYHSGKEKQRSRLLLGWSIEKRSYVDEQRSTHGPYGAQGEGREHLLIPKWLVDFRDGGPQEQGGFLLPVVLEHRDLRPQFRIPLPLNFRVAPLLTALVKRNVSEHQRHVRILFPERTSTSSR